MLLGQNIASEDAHEAVELVWYGALIVLYSQLLTYNFANTPCSHFVQKLKMACGAGEKVDETIALFFFFSQQHRESKLRGKKHTNTYLPRWGSSFLPMGWAESVASFSEAAQWLQRILQLSRFWCQEILSFPTLNDQRRPFGHWNLLPSSPKAAQELRAQGAAVKWQDYKSLSEGWWKWNWLKFCWKIPPCFLLCSSQQN